MTPPAGVPSERFRRARHTGMHASIRRPRSGHALLCPVLLALSGGCAAFGAGAAERPNRAIREVTLVDSVHWETGLEEGLLYRIAVHYAAETDTLPGILTPHRPVVLGASVIYGLDYRDGVAVRGFRYDAASRAVQFYPLPDDMAGWTAHALSPDARHLAYIARDSAGLLSAVIRAWPTGRTVYRSGWVAGYPSDVDYNSARWIAPGSYEIRIRLGDDVSTERYLRVRGSVHAEGAVADTITTSVGPVSRRTPARSRAFPLPASAPAARAGGRRAGGVAPGPRDQARAQRPHRTREEQAEVGVDPELRAAGARAGVELAVRTEVARVVDRLPEVVRPVRILGAVVLLAPVAGVGEVAVADPRGELVAPDRDHRGHADLDLAAPVVRRPQDRPGRDLRLVDGRHRLRLARQPALDP